MSMKGGLPLFPLRTVLFPGGKLPLRVFEQRYLDMVSHCLKTESEFGVCLIRSGPEVGQAAEPYHIGTTARIVSWDMEQVGILSLVVRGQQRFRIEQVTTQSDQSLSAQVQLLGPEPEEALPPAYADLADLLRRIVQELGDELEQPLYFPPAQWESLPWVAHRLAECLPLEQRQRQSLLEMDAAALRLTQIAQWLSPTAPTAPTA